MLYLLLVIGLLIIIIYYRNKMPNLQPIFGNRINPLHFSAAEMERIFKVIADQFTIEWLEAYSNNPMNLLWHRNDTLATVELTTFGICLEKLVAIDPDWVKHQVTLIKGDDRKNQRGAIFEILALGMMKSNNQIVKPAKANNKGWDGLVQLEDGKSLRVSIKNFDDSTRYWEFHGKSSHLEYILTLVMQELSIDNVHIYLDAKSYPTTDDWNLIESELKGLLKAYQADKNINPEIGIWKISINPLITKISTYHPQRHSYSLLVTSALHDNEKANFYSNLEKACSELSKYEPVEDEKVINVVMVHLPFNASVTFCAEMMDNYLVRFPGLKLSGFILYQPVFKRNNEEGWNTVYHATNGFFRHHRIKGWENTTVEITFDTPFGEYGNDLASGYFEIEKNGKIERMPTGDRYIFQRGNHFLREFPGVTELFKNATMVVNSIQSPGSGIAINIEIEPTAQHGSRRICVLQPLEEKLLIL